MHLNHQRILKSPTADWIVFFHGMGGDCSIFSKQVPLFQQHFNLLFIDLPGHGRSIGVEGREPVEFSVQKVIELLEFLKVPAAHFMGVSLGTLIMQRIALQRPELIKSMVLAGAVRRFQPWGEFLVRLSLRFPLKQLMPVRWSYALFAYALLPRRNHQRSRAIFLRAARDLRASDYHAWGAALAFAPASIYARLARRRNRLPKLYICGAQDHMFLPALRDFVRREEGAEWVVLPGCGHVCHIEAASRFNALALSFFQRVSARPRAPAQASLGGPGSIADVTVPIPCARGYAAANRDANPGGRERGTDTP
ncbi:MAG: alpha/beta hydrolase [Cystobacter sp.]